MDYRFDDIFTVESLDAVPAPLEALRKAFERLSWYSELEGRECPSNTRATEALEKLVTNIINRRLGQKRFPDSLFVEPEVEEEDPEGLYYWSTKQINKITYSVRFLEAIQEKAQELSQVQLRISEPARKYIWSFVQMGRNAGSEETIDTRVQDFIEEDSKAIKNNLLISCYEIAYFFHQTLDKITSQKDAILLQAQSRYNRQITNIQEARGNRTNDLQEAVSTTETLLDNLRTAAQQQNPSSESIEALRTLAGKLNSMVQSLPTEQRLMAQEQAEKGEYSEVASCFDQQIPQLQETLSGLMNNILEQRLFSELSPAGHQRT